MNKVLVSLLFLLFISDLSAQNVRFNEAMSTNSIFLDEDEDSPDWFELYNTTSNLISLQGWTVSDDFTEPAKWIIPEHNLASDSYLMIWASGKDRYEIGFTRTLINLGTSCKYIVPTESVSNQWRTLAFDDSSWSNGNSGFGYGDGDDATVVPAGTGSVFIRKEFNISSAEDIEQLIFDIDYDDSFVAYLNGTEIARANIEGNPSFDDFATTDREATLINGGLPERFIIDNPAAYIQTGENVLAIQVHNISNTSSDMTLIPYLSAIYSDEPTEGIAPPPFLLLGDRRFHTNFKIANGGESLYLFDGNGMVVDSIFVEGMPSDISLGISNSDNSIVYFDNPTPGFPNSGSEYEGIGSSEIIFSHPGGVTNSLSLALSGVEADESIRYTLDATVPDENSTLYFSTIPINENTVVRARVFKDNYLPSPTQSKTYILEAAHDLPVIALVTDPDNYFDSDDGIYVLGDDYEGDFPFFGSNIWEDWERPVNFSLYEPNGTLGVTFDAGSKIFGGWSRGNEQRSLSIFARNRYGFDEIDYPLFPDNSYSKYQAIVLRNSGNDWNGTMLRDGMQTSLMKDADLEIQAFRPTATYINGEYWGIYNMREKINEHYLASRHNIDPDEINIVELNGEVIHGSNEDYLNLIDFVTNNSLASTANYDQVKEEVDIENFALYYIAQIYFDNRDWPGNNIKYWKPNGGKFRWILFDTDFGFNTWNEFNYNVNTLGFALAANGPGWPNPPWSTLLFRRMTESDEFMKLFVNQFADEMNSRFLPVNVREHIDSLDANISSEINRHFDRWEGDNGWREWSMLQMRNFAGLRPARVKEHILDEFNLVDYHPLTITNEDPIKGFVKLNSLFIRQENWTGDYFEGVPVKLTAIAESGYQFSHWSGGISSTEAELEVDMQSALTLQPNFEISTTELDVVINEINYNSAETSPTGDWIELHNPGGISKDLSNWVFKDDDDTHGFVIPVGTNLAANDYLILSKDAAQFNSVYPNIENVIGDFDFGLSSNGDAARLYDDENVLQDEVYYLPTLPWPPEANGQGPTLELIHPSFDNSLPESWKALHPFGSPGMTNDDFVFVIDANSNLEFARHYPNPFTNQINIEIQLAEPSSIKASLYDVNGKLVREIYNEDLLQGNHLIQDQLGFLNNGIYILELKVNEYASFSKWIKH